jgi:Family of unknown function (DUF5681)
MSDKDDPATRSYRNPPVEHRFRKGVSGNPKGRPRKNRALVSTKVNGRPGIGFEDRIKSLAIEEAYRLIAIRPREVADSSGIDDAHDMPSLMEGKRDAEAVASGCLQTGMNLSDLVLAEPGNQLMPAIGRIGEALGARLCTSPEASVECVLGNVNTQYSVSHFKAFSSDPRSDGSASINLVHRICARTRPRIPSSLNSGAWKSGAESTARAWSPKGRRRLTAFLAIRQK